MSGFNPMKMFNPMMMPGGINPMQFLPGMPNMPGMGGSTPINREQFKQYLPHFNEQIFSQLQAQARQRGISEEDIQQGMEFIKKLTQ